MPLTADAYAKVLADRGEKLRDAPQPYGQSVAAVIKRDPDGATLELAHLLAYALRDLDVARGAVPAST